MNERYPHVCPVRDCGAPAYVGLNQIKCTGIFCAHWDPDSRQSDRMPEPAGEPVIPSPVPAWHHYLLKP
jgi:hypothetical protein